MYGTHLRLRVAGVVGTANVVLLWNKARTQAFYMGMTNRVSRPPSVKEHGAVTLGEAPRAEAKPIVAWHPPDGADGHAFIYAR